MNNFQAVDEVTAETFRKSIMEVAGEENNVGEDSLNNIKQELVESWLGELPEPEEIFQAWATMKESAGGRDEVTIGMVSSLPTSGRRAVAGHAIRTWKDPRPP